MNSFALRPVKKIALRAVRPADSDLVLGWQSETGARQHFKNPLPPSLAEHRAWFAARMVMNDPRLWIIEVDDAPAGIVRLDDNKNGEFEISILVAIAHRGKGVARRALQLVRNVYPDTTLIANVDPRNEASRQLFIKAGYVPVSDRIFRYSPNKSS